MAMSSRIWPGSVLPMAVVGQSPDEQVLPWQLWPQKPQLLGSAFRSTQVVGPHIDLPLGHPQAPLMQVPVAQLWLHPPQFFESVFVSTQWPLHIVHPASPPSLDEPEEDPDEDESDTEESPEEAPDEDPESAPDEEPEDVAPDEEM
jgi:hypothetical protein